MAILTGSNSTTPPKDRGQYANTKVDQRKNVPYSGLSFPSIVDDMSSTTTPKTKYKQGSDDWVRSTSIRPVNVNAQIADAWFKTSINLISESGEGWIFKSILKSERYMMALYDTDEYRAVIATYLLILRNNSDLLSTDPSARQVLERALRMYINSQHNAQNRIRFIRSVRAAGLLPTGG